MKEVCTNPLVHFFPVEGANRFSILAPTTRLIADRIIHDDRATAKIEFTEQELNDLFRK
jgi:hypothetical protein